MATLTNSETFTIDDGPTTQEQASALILPVAGAGQGDGRLVHPTLGTFDYDYPPDQWINIDGDIIIPPIWESNKTLNGGQNTLWAGDISDVECIERWDSDASMPMTMLRTLLSFWMNPPDPKDGYVEWHPSYTTALKYKVVVLDMTVNGEEIKLTYFSRQDWVEGIVEIRYRVVDYA